MRILIADDDENLVDALARRCERLGFEVDRAHDGATALDSIDRVEPDLVILDVNMPGGSGISLCQMMAGDDLLRDIPVIIMTGRQDEETIRGCHELMAYYVLKSPDVWTRLEPLIGELLASPPSDAPVRAPSAHQATAHQVTAHQVTAHQATAHPDEGYLDAVLAALRDDTTYLAVPSDDAGPGSPTPRVLCIEDDRDFSLAMKRRLEERGVEVRQAFSGMEGYRSAFTNQVQAIVLDYEMPDGNGDYVLRRLDENPLTCDIPVIALTGHRDKPLERKLIGLGVKSVLSKPPDWERLWSELRPHVRQNSEALELAPSPATRSHRRSPTRPTGSSAADGD